MRRLVPNLVVLLSAPFLLTACGQGPTPPPGGSGASAEHPQDSTRRVGKPVPPLQLAVPVAMPERLDGENLKSLGESELLFRANRAMAEEDYRRAAAYQYWYVQKSKTGQYNLACFLARIGRTDAAFYWLQVAAAEEGVDSRHAQRDEDLASLWRDPRWPQVSKYLTDCNRYFESAPLGRTTLVVPRGYQKEVPISVVLWLHGLGSRPDDFVNESCQRFADELNVALIGVSGTKPRGPRAFVWAEDPELDLKRLRAGLAEVSDRVTVRKGYVITCGFSQGAQVALDVAVLHPDDFAGAIVLSPGGQPHLGDVKPGPLLARRGFVLSCGAPEHPMTVRQPAVDAAWLREAAAHVVHREYPGVSAHAFPAGFDERFPEWVRFILKARGE
jgi:predicted esterase